MSLYSECSLGPQGAFRISALKRIVSKISLSKKACDYIPVVGLEIHAQIWSQSKLFSDAPNRDDAPLNSVVSLFDIATPGTLPRLNRYCVLKCLKTALLLNCEIPSWCRFDRKHYFYPDMPSGYQITQQDHPIAKNGYFDFYVHSKTRVYEKRVHIKQIQLETDSGKSLIHGDRHLVDLNRAGVGLIEIVTLPELHSPDEAMALMEQLRLYFVHNKICMGDLFKGQIRADANVSMRKDGVNYPRVEIKNINSMNHLRRAIEGEIERQRKILQEGGIVEEETRSLLDDNLTSKASRSKGDSLDYRIIPEPNLPRLIIEPKWIQEAKEQLRLDLQHLKYIKEYNMNPHAALQIATDASLNKFVSKSITGMKIPVEKFLDSLSALENICSKLHVHYPPDKENFPQIFVELLHLETTGRITRFICKDLIKFYLEANEFIPVEQKIEKERLWRITDPTDIMRAIEETMESFPKVVEKALLEDKKRNHFNKLRNEVVLLSKRKISMEDVEDGLTRKLSILKPK